MAIQEYFCKDADATLDYQVDWATWLGSDTISTVTWTVPTGLTNVTTSNTTTTATIWLSGGTAGSTYEVLCHIVTSQGRADDRTIGLEIVQK